MLPATLGVGQHVLGARLHPAHRPADESGQGAERRLVRVGPRLHAEPAADVGHDDTRPARLAPARTAGPARLGWDAPLARGVVDEAVALPPGDAGPALHRSAAHPADVEVELDDDVALGEVGRAGEAQSAPRRSCRDQGTARRHRRRPRRDRRRRRGARSRRPPRRPHPWRSTWTRPRRRRSVRRRSALAPTPARGAPSLAAGWGTGWRRYVAAGRGSSAVNTPSTPGIAAASLLSMPVSSAWANSDRTHTAWAARSTAMSSTKRPPPVTKRGSSIRRTALPSTLTVDPARPLVPLLGVDWPAA